MLLELLRRRRGEMPELPYSVALIVIAVNALSANSLLLFRIGALVVLFSSIYEVRLFVQRGAPEPSLAGALVSGLFGVLILAYWAVISINQHLNLTMG